MSYFIPDPRWEIPELLIPGRKPIGEVEIDWNNRLTKDLKAYGLGTYDILNKKILSYYTDSADPIADYLRFNDDARNEAIVVDSLGNDWGSGSTAITMATNCRFIGSSDSDEDTVMGQWSNCQGGTTNNAKRLMLRYHSDEPAIYVVGYDTQSRIYNISQDLDDGAFHTIAAMFRNGDLKLNVDGVTDSGGTACSALLSSSHSKFPEVMGGHNATGTSQTDGARFDVKWWGFWDRGLSDDELLRLHLDPYQFLIPK